MARSRHSKRLKPPGAKLLKKEEKERRSNAAEVNRDPTQVLSLILAIFTGLVVSGITMMFTKDKTLPSNGPIVSNNELPDPWSQEVSVTERSEVFEGCNSSPTSLRHVRDGFFTDEEVEALLEMMEVGMQSSPASGGPTIMDLHSGLLKDGAGVINIYQQHRGFEPVEFTTEQYEVYSKMFDNIKKYVEEVNDLDEGTLYFTAPTFVARLVGNSSWTPTEIHDEYWHEHIDKDNTGHYDYSGLVYLSDYGSDFSGGEFQFIDSQNITVLPRKGRLITFSSGKENLHQVQKVNSGARFTMSMWFTCDPKMRFTNFKSKMDERLASSKE